jgi:uncharacterized protein YbaP (TraB family)
MEKNRNSAFAARILLAILPLLLPPALGATFRAHAAQAIAPDAHAAPQAPITRGLLWKIEGGGKTSYVFGTVHSDDDRVLALPPAVKKAFAQSTSFTTETIVSSSGMIAAAQAMFFNDGRTLEGVIGKELYEQTRAALVARGLSTDIDKKKPWAVMAELSMPKATKPFLDLALLADAARAGKSVHGLETMEEQIAVFDDLSLSDQSHLLAQAVRDAPKWDSQLEELIRAYLARDLGALRTLEESDAPSADPVYRAFMNRLVSERNRRMAERALPQLRKGGAFIAVGALHLAGDDGVLQLLQKAGYRVTPVY